MKQHLIILGLGGESVDQIHPLLLEHLPEHVIQHVGLLDNLNHQQIETRYGASPDEASLLLKQQNGGQIALSLSRLSQAMQHKIDELEALGAENILLLWHGGALETGACKATLLEPDRLIPPLVASIVAGHRVGIVLSDPSRLAPQQRKWGNLSSPPLFAIACPLQHDENALIDAALSLQEQGADVVVLDCIGYRPHHRDFIQKLLGIPVLLTHALIVRLAAELVI